MSTPIENPFSENSVSFESPSRLATLFKSWTPLLLCAIVFAIAFYLWPPDVRKLTTENPKTTAFIERYQKHARDAGESDAISQTWIPLSEISPSLKNAVLIAEDDAFFTHSGINLDQIKSAFEAWRQGRKLRGASTLTQQLAKNLYLSPSRNPVRKLKEFLITRRLEENLSKERILELYLNVIEWGKGIYGAEAASQFYFHTSAKTLSEHQAVTLAAIIPNPIFLTSRKQARRLQAREATIANHMRHYDPLPAAE